jgi:hypothetical protein|tara:strand:- start:166 stop:438 length:273 start_codon:yes stop_codon:yes gene_type:complete
MNRLLHINSNVILVAMFVMLGSFASWVMYHTTQRPEIQILNVDNNLASNIVNPKFTIHNGNKSITVISKSGIIDGDIMKFDGKTTITIKE